MKYTIETNENGYTETLEICGKEFKKTWKKVERGRYRCEEGDFTDRIIEAGIVPEIYGDDLYGCVDERIDPMEFYIFETDYLMED